MDLLIQNPVKVKKLVLSGSFEEVDQIGFSEVEFVIKPYFVFVSEVRST